MASVEDIVITIIEDEPGPVITDVPAPSLDIQVSTFLQPQVLEVVGEMQVEATINSSLEPEFVEIVRPSDVDTITIPEANMPEVIEIGFPVVQGPPGVQNVYVGPTPPLNPEIGWIWIDTS